MFLFAIPNAVKVNLAHIKLNVKNPLIAYAFVLTIFLRLTFILFIIIMRGKRDADLVKWLEKFMLIQTSYFDRFQHIPTDKSLRKYLFINMFLMLAHGFSLFGNIFKFYFHNELWRFFDLYMLCGIINLQHFTMWFHEVVLCYLHECCSKLNYQLQYKDMDPKLSLIYYQVTQLIKEINQILSSIIIWVQLCLIISNAIVGYISILFFTGSIMGTETDSYDFLLGGKLYILLCAQMYIYFRLSDRVVKTTGNTSSILQMYSTRETITEVSSSFICTLQITI